MTLTQYGRARNQGEAAAPIAGPPPGTAIGHHPRNAAPARGHFSINRKDKPWGRRAAARRRPRPETFGGPV